MVSWPRSFFCFLSTKLSPAAPVVQLNLDSHARTGQSPSKALPQRTHALSKQKRRSHLKLPSLPHQIVFTRAFIIQPVRNTRRSQCRTVFSSCTHPGETPVRQALLCRLAPAYVKSPFIFLCLYFPPLAGSTSPSSPPRSNLAKLRLYRRRRRRSLFKRSATTS